jgi:hypothetical protein
VVNITFNDTIYHCSYVAGTTGWGMGGGQGRKGGGREGGKIRLRLGWGHDKCTD